MVSSPATWITSPTVWAIHAPVAIGLQARVSALARVVGGPVAVEVVVTSAWLATQAAAGDREVAQDAS